MDFRTVEEFITSLPEKTIIFAKLIHGQSFASLSFQTFLKYLERLTYKNVLKVIGKGVYCRPILTPFGVLGVSDNDIKDYFIADNRCGVAVGYDLYNKYGLTTQIAKKIKVYSNKALYNVQNITNVQVKRCAYTSDLQFSIECLEILENYSHIEDLNKEAFYRFCENIGHHYEEEMFLRTFAFGFYKKRTLAFLKHILDCFKIKNSLDRYLNATSKYKYPKLEDLHAA